MIEIISGGFPLAPMVLALILGPLADENFRRALEIFSSKDLMHVVSAHPIGTALIFVLIFVVIYTFYDGIFKRGRSA